MFAAILTAMLLTASQDINTGSLVIKAKPEQKQTVTTTQEQTQNTQNQTAGSTSKTTQNTSTAGSNSTANSTANTGTAQNKQTNDVSKQTDGSKQTTSKQTETVIGQQQNSPNGDEVIDVIGAAMQQDDSVSLTQDTAILSEALTNATGIANTTGAVDTRPDYTVVPDPNNTLAIPQCTDPKVKEWNPVIIDLDFYSDIDDAMSVRMLAELDNLGYCDVKAAGLCVNGFERTLHNMFGTSGLYNVPIGSSSMDIPVEDECIWGSFTDPYNCDDTLIIKDAVTLYKQVLKDSKHPVKIITTGWLTNIQKLLEDPEGYELVKNKCEGIYIVGGSYPSGLDNNFFILPEAITSIKYTIDRSPAPLIFVTNLTLGTRSDTGPIPGFGYVTCGTSLYDSDPDQTDLLTKALQSYMDVWDASADKVAGDPMGVWIACMPKGIDACYLDDSHIYIADNGSDEFNEELAPNCKVAYLNGNSAKYYSRKIDWLLTRALARKQPTLDITIN